MATLKISDLSVGDWVRTNGGNVTVDIISPLEVVVMNDYGNLYACKIEDIKPIPITPEILEANGIRKTYECDEYAVYKGEEFSITEYYTELWEIKSRRNRAVIKYTHQLQHALRLAGIDKEIVMPNK